jgi:hypothetical protein
VIREQVEPVAVALDDPHAAPDGDPVDAVRDLAQPTADPGARMTVP